MWAVKKILFPLDFSLPRCFDTTHAQGRASFSRDVGGGVRRRVYSRPSQRDAGADLSLTALSECAAIAGACGYPPSAAFLEEKRTQITAVGSSLTSSMYRDLMRNAPVEVNTILGDLLDYGRKLGISTPILQAAFVNLSIHQRARNIDRTESASSVTESARRQ